MRAHKYPSDVADAQWRLIEGLIPAYPGGRPRKTDPRDVVGARATVLTIERNVTVRDWLTRTTDSRQDLARRVRAWERQAGHTDIHGELAYVRLSLHGFKGDQFRVRWSIYYDRSKRPASSAKVC